MKRSLSEPALIFDFTDAAGRPEQLAFADPVEVISTTVIAEVQACCMGTLGTSRRLSAGDVARYVSEGGVSRYLRVQCALDAGQ